MWWWRGCGCLRRATGATVHSGRPRGSTLSALRTAETARTSSSSFQRGLLTWTRTLWGRTWAASSQATGGKDYFFGIFNCFGSLVRVGWRVTVEFWKVFWPCWHYRALLADFRRVWLPCIKESARTTHNNHVYKMIFFAIFVWQIICWLKERKTWGCG